MNVLDVPCNVLWKIQMHFQESRSKPANQKDSLAFSGQIQGKSRPSPGEELYLFNSGICWSSTWQCSVLFLFVLTASSQLPQDG